jgi:hypothetical protein
MVPLKDFRLISRSRCELQQLCVIAIATERIERTIPILYLPDRSLLPWEINPATNQSLSQTWIEPSEQFTAIVINQSKGEIPCTGNRR